MGDHFRGSSTTYLPRGAFITNMPPPARHKVKAWPSERNNGTAKRWLYAWSRAKYGNFTSWIKLVDKVQDALNHTVQATTKKTPMQL